MMKKILLGLSTIVMLLVSGCATTGIEITDFNNRINTPKYSITVPANRGWKIEKNTVDPDVASIIKTIGTNSYMMRCSTNIVINDYMKSWTAEQVANNYREGEQANMLIRGVMSGMYELKNVKISKRKVGNKQFYTMDYTTITNKIEQRASLYLYFPKKTNIGTFFVSLYSEGFPRNKPPHQSFKNEFLETLNSLEMK